VELTVRIPRTHTSSLLCARTVAVSPANVTPESGLASTPKVLASGAPTAV